MSEVSNFTVGQEVKNYKEMCRLFGEEEKKGSPRNRQIEEWKRFLDWDKKGHTYIIREIYALSKPKLDKRREGGKSIYSIQLKKLIMHNIFCITQKNKINNNILMCTSKRLLIDIFECYSILEQDFSPEELEALSAHNLDDSDLNFFTTRFESKTSDILKSSLKSLLKDGFLESYEKVYVIIENKRERCASEEETKKIDSLKKKIMNDMDIKNERYIFKSKRKELYENLNAELKLIEKWEVSYKTNTIKINSETLSKIEEYKLSSYEEKSLKTDLILDLCDFLDPNAFGYFKKDKEKIEEYYIQKGLNINGRNDSNKITESGKKDFSVDMRYWLPFKTLKKDFLEKQTLLCNLLVRSNWDNN